MTEAPPGAQQFSFEFKKSNVDVALKSASKSNVGVSILALSAVVKDAKATSVYYHNRFAKQGEAPQQLVAKKARPSSHMSVGRDPRRCQFSSRIVMDRSGSLSESE